LYGCRLRHKTTGGPPAALPGQASGGMLGAMVRIGPPQDGLARFFIDSSSRFEKKIGLKSGSSRVTAHAPPNPTILRSAHQRFLLDPPL